MYSSASALDYWQDKRLALGPSYRSSKVDGHQWMRGQEEVVESEGVFEVWQDVAVPGDEPGQCKDGPHLRSEEFYYTY